MARTVRNVHTVIRESLGHAMKWGLLWRNSAQAVDAPRPGVNEVVVPESEEVLRILELSKETPYHAAFHFIAYTGCRRGECLGLRWQDIDFDRGIASIVQTIQRVQGRGLIIDSPKSKKGRRAIAIDAETVSVLKAHRVRQLEHRLQLGDEWENHDFVFPGVTGRPLDPSVLTHRFGRLAERAQTPGVNLKALRHFHATLLLRQGVHPKIVQERLGHATISITLDTYSHVIPSLQTEAADTFAGAMSQVAYSR